jgi:hypothetical protein
MPELVIDDKNYLEHCEPVVINGEKTTFGLVPRNYNTHPIGCYGAVPWVPSQIKLIPREEWSSRIKDKQQAQSQLSDIRLAGNDGKMVPSLDQNGKGYCWAHSTTHAVMLNRMVANDPYEPLSAYAIACIIKNYADEGGWGALSMDFAIKRGIPSQKYWAQQSMSRSNDNEATWVNAALHKVTDGWVDLSVAPYDRDFSFDQEMSCLLQNIPVVKDENWWGHSICGLDAYEFDSSLPLSDINRWGVRIWNSWSDSWSDRGMGLLRGNKAVSNGAVASRVVLAA